MGRVSHLGITADDPDRAAEFYRSLRLGVRDGRGNLDQEQLVLVRPEVKAAAGRPSSWDGDLVPTQQVSVKPATTIEVPHVEHQVAELFDPYPLSIAPVDHAVSTRLFSETSWGIVLLRGPFAAALKEGCT